MNRGAKRKLFPASGSGLAPPRSRVVGWPHRIGKTACELAAKAAARLLPLKRPSSIVIPREERPRDLFPLGAEQWVGADLRLRPSPEHLLRRPEDDSARGIEPAPGVAAEEVLAELPLHRPHPALLRIELDPALPVGDGVEFLLVEEAAAVLAGDATDLRDTGGAGEVPSS